MRVRLVVRRAGTFAGREVRVGDVISLDTADCRTVFAADLAWNPGAALGLLADGTADPIDITADDARRLLGASATPLSPDCVPRPMTRVLPFRRREA